MHIFLDESGDLGFDLTRKKTSRYFNITLLTCDSDKSLSKIHSAVKQTRKRKLNHRKKRNKNELKGSFTDQPVKNYFYQYLKEIEDIHIYTSILDKTSLKQPHNKIDKHSIYKALSCLTLEKVLFDSPTYVTLFADKCKQGLEAKDFHATLYTSIKTICHPGVTITVKQIPSTSNLGLQAVDMFAYGIYKKYESKNLEWYNIFKEKIAEETIYTLKKTDPNTVSSQGS